MWDTAIDSTSSHQTYLSHDLPCGACGHAPHRYLSCSTTCDCVPPPAPGSLALTA